jgi:tetratricopeptide (TPR) repeat protein
MTDPNVEARTPKLLIAALGILIVIAGSLGIYEFTHRTVQADRAQTTLETSQRVARRTPVLLVAPGPLPTALPLLGPDGVDADGYPKKYVDRVALRSLLHAHRYQELSAHGAELQKAFEDDPRKEYWPIDFSEAFASPEPEIEDDLQAWTEATPDSFAPWLAQGSHRFAAAQALRGTNYATKTPEADMQAMRIAGERAMTDLRKAYALRPQLVAAMRQIMRMASFVSDDKTIEDMKDRGTRLCGECLQIRVAYLHGLTPRWGGSYEAMRAFVRESPVAGNPRFRVLGGLEDLDRASLLSGEKKYPEALQAIDLALKRGSYWEFHWERGKILVRMQREQEALVEFNRADAQRPMHLSIVSERIEPLVAQKEHLAAAKDLLTTLRLDPTAAEAKRILPAVVNNVLFQAQQFEKAGKHTEALDASDLGMDLAPRDPTAQGVHATIALGDATTPERIAQVQAHVAQNPGDFRAVQQLDYALSKTRSFDRILPLWDAYIKVHPEDGRAYMERAGTNHNLGRGAEAIADARRACELGINGGCERARR